MPRAPRQLHVRAVHRFGSVDQRRRPTARLARDAVAERVSVERHARAKAAHGSTGTLPPVGVPDRESPFVGGAAYCAQLLEERQREQTRGALRPASRSEAATSWRYRRSTTRTALPSLRGTVPGAPELDVGGEREGVGQLVPQPAGETPRAVAVGGRA